MICDQSPYGATRGLFQLIFSKGEGPKDTRKQQTGQWLVFVIRNGFKHKSLVIISLVAMLFEIEIALRVYEIRTIPRGTELNAILIADEQMGWKPRPGFTDQAVRINFLGFRGPDISREKPDNTYRIVAMGDSATFGPMATLSYPEMLNGLLNNHKPSACHWQYEVVNAGVNGYDSAYILKHLQLDVMPLAPDLVIIYAGWNELFMTNPLQLELESVSSRSLIFKYSFAYLYNRTPLALKFELLKGLYEDFAPTIFRANLNQSIDMAQSGGSDVILVTLPSVLGDEHLDNYLSILHYPTFTSDYRLVSILWQVYNDVIREVALEQDVPISEMALVIQAMDNEGALFYDTVHLQSEPLANVLEDDLLQSNLLPCSLTMIK